jgi:molybdopterin synthase catalytic subunit
MIQLTLEAIDPTVLVERAQSPAAGAVLLFLGCTRQHTAGRETIELKYDAYVEMAEKELAAIKAEASKRWGLTECLIVHRLGTVPVGTASVAIVVASAHRRAAFEAGEWLINTLKQRVPIWKQEHWADGSTEWVHPQNPPIEAISENPLPG